MVGEVCVPEARCGFVHYGSLRKLPRTLVGSARANKVSRIKGELHARQPLSAVIVSFEMLCETFSASVNRSVRFFVHFLSVRSLHPTFGSFYNETLLFARQKHTSPSVTQSFIVLS